MLARATWAGSSVLALTLTSLDLGGHNYPLDTDQFKVKGPNKAGQTVGNAVGGGIIGTIIGCAVGRGAGAPSAPGQAWPQARQLRRLLPDPGLDSRRGAGHLPPQGADHG